jgi:hypothetical protein
MDKYLMQIAVCFFLLLFSWYEKVVLWIRIGLNADPYRIRIQGFDDKKKL